MLGPRTGVGRYVSELATELGRRAQHDDLKVRLVPFTIRGWRSLDVPPGTFAWRRPFSARLLHAAWARSAFPPVELFAGGCDVFHATNFVLPPRRSAAGVVTIHDLTFARHPGTVDAAVLRYQRLVPRSIRAADMVLCPARATAADVSAEYDLDPARVVATPLGVDEAWRVARPATLSELARLGLPERYLLFVGRREPRKDLATLVAAHDALLAEEPGAPDLVFVGPPGWGEQPRPTPRRHVLDYVPEPVVRSIVAAAAALVMPSRYEGFGLPLLEALACGVRVVATDIPVHREVAGPYARYVEAGDVSAVASALHAVLSDQVEAAERRAWSARWTWRQCATDTLAAYERAVG